MLLARSSHLMALLTSRLSVNPFSKQHGAPSDSDRHVGDLGNFQTDAQGNSKGSITDNQIKLIGQESVLGVSVPSFDPISPDHFRIFIIFSRVADLSVCNSAQSLSMLVPMTWAKAVMSRARQPVMLADDPPVVSLVSRSRRKHGRQQKHVVCSLETLG